MTFFKRISTNSCKIGLTFTNLPLPKNFFVCIAEDREREEKEVKGDIGGKRDKRKI